MRHELHAHGIQVVSLNPIRETLEDYFVKSIKTAAPISLRPPAAHAGRRSHSDLAQATRGSRGTPRLRYNSYFFLSLPRSERSAGVSTDEP